MKQRAWWVWLTVCAGGLLLCAISHKCQAQKPPKGVYFLLDVQPTAGLDALDASCQTSFAQMALALLSSGLSVQFRGDSLYITQQGRTETARYLIAKQTLRLTFGDRWHEVGLSQPSKSILHITFPLPYLCGRRLLLVFKKG